MRNRLRGAWLILASLICLGAYGGLYLMSSRRGYAEAERYRSEGFYYFEPASSPDWRLRNLASVYFFWPLNQLDCWLGTGRSPACEPLRDLSGHHRSQERGIQTAGLL